MRRQRLRPGQLTSTQQRHSLAFGGVVVVWDWSSVALEGATCEICSASTLEWTPACAVWSLPAGMQSIEAVMGWAAVC